MTCLSDPHLRSLDVKMGIAGAVRAGRGAVTHVINDLREYSSRRTQHILRVGALCVSEWESEWLSKDPNPPDLFRHRDV